MSFGINVYVKSNYAKEKNTVDVLCYTHTVLDRRIKRWPKKAILWVIEKENDGFSTSNSL